MIRPEVLDALLAAGATAEMIVAAVKADAQADAARAESERQENEARAERQREMNAARQRRHRDRNAVSRVTGVSNGDERDEAPFLDKESFPQTPFKEINPSPGVCIAPARERDFSEEVREAWNAMAERTGLSAVAKLNTARIAKIRARIAEHSIDKFTEAIAAVERSPFCRGDSANGWRADFDFLLQPKSFNRLIEGSYDRAKPNPGTSRGGRGLDPGDDPYIAAYRSVSAG